MDYTITFDGGAVNNGRKEAGYSGRSYGSYELKTRTGKSEIIRLEFDDGTTNNESEYKSLLSALVDLIGRIHDAGHKPSLFTLHVIGDSQLVLYQVNEGDEIPRWSCYEEHLKVHRDRIRQMIGQFKEVKLEWIRREYIKGVLGH